MFTTLILHAVAGFCGTGPSVEFYQWINSIVKHYRFPTDPVPGPKEGNPDPEPDFRWSIALSLAGGIGGGFLLTSLYPDSNIMGVAGAFMGGRVITAVASLAKLARISK